MPGVTVLIPSYRRPGPLGRCLDALAQQSRPPDQVIVSIHRDDEDSATAVARHPGVECVRATDRRVVPLMQAGLARATGDVIAITDDDALPRRDWLDRLLGHYGDGVGGVGGRDLIGEDEAGELTARVGLVQPFGRVIYKHHLGTGAPRDVDVLKGVNMSMRRELWRLSDSLRGTGMQLHWEIDLCLRARAHGWRLVYDPAIVVDHPRAGRVDEEARTALSFAAVRDQVHNEFLAVLRWSPRGRRLVALLYAVLVGHRNAPGPLLLAERLVRERDRRAVIRRAAAGLSGRALALRRYRAGPGR